MLRSCKLSWRQKKRQREKRYWQNVCVNTRKWLDRLHARREREDEAVFEEYKCIVAEELETQPVDVEVRPLASIWVLVKQQVLKMHLLALPRKKCNVHRC